VLLAKPLTLQGLDSLSPARTLRPGVDFDTDEYAHNIALTVLGRMGIVGLGLWAGFLLASYRHILRGVRASGRLADSRFHERLTFVSAYTLAVFGAALFGVLLESPFGAIPYYFLLGLAIKWAERRPAVGEVEDLVASQSEG